MKSVELTSQASRNHTALSCQDDMVHCKSYKTTQNDQRIHVNIQQRCCLRSQALSESLPKGFDEKTAAGSLYVWQESLKDFINVMKQKLNHLYADEFVEDVALIELAMIVFRNIGVANGVENGLQDEDESELHEWLEAVRHKIYGAVKTDSTNRNRIPGPVGRPALFSWNPLVPLP